MRRGELALILALTVAGGLWAPGVAAASAGAQDPAEARLASAAEAWGMGEAAMKSGDVDGMIGAAQHLADAGAFTGARLLLDEARRRSVTDAAALQRIEALMRMLPTPEGVSIGPRSDFRPPTPIDDRQTLTIPPHGQAWVNYSVSGDGRTLLAVVVGNDPRAAQIRQQLSVSVSAAGRPETMLSPPFPLSVIEMPRSWPPGPRRVTVHNRGQIPASVQLLLLPDS